MDLPFGLQLGGVDIGEGHDDVEVLGLGQVVQEEENTYNVEPPADVGGAGPETDAGQVHVVEPDVKIGDEPSDGLTHREYPVLGAASLDDDIANIEHEEADHEHDLGHEDDVGVHFGPTGHLRAVESADAEHITTPEEDHTGADHGDAEELVDDHQQVVADAHESEGAVGAGDAIDYDLDHFDVDHEESDIDDAVEHSRNGTFEHFLLAECDQHHIAEPFLPSVATADGRAEADAIHDVLPLPFKVEEGGEQDGEENDIF